MAIVIFLIWFFNRKFEVILDYNNGDTEEILYIKYNNKINEKDIKGKEDLGESFIDWYEVTYDKEKKEVISDEPFDFSTKIKSERRLKALYEGVAVERITVAFDSKGGTEVASVTLEKGKELILPENPTRSGYTFNHWEDINQVPIGNGALLGEDITLYAVWDLVPVESISLSISNKILHQDGTRTSKATASVANSNGAVTYSLNDTTCATINSSTGDIALKTEYGTKGSDTYNKCYVNGSTITVTGKLPSGKSASATFSIEKLLILTFEGINYSENSGVRTAELGIKSVTSNISVNWETMCSEVTNATIGRTNCVLKAPKTKTETSIETSSIATVTDNGVDSEVNTDITIVASSAAGQQRILSFTAVMPN